MLIQSAEYALRVLVFLARLYPKGAPSSEIASETRVPHAYAEKILQRLRSARLVRGRRGRSGGYRLSRPPAEIRVLDAIEPFQAVVQYDGCPLGLAEHATRLCPLHSRLNQAAAAVREIFGNATLEDMIVQRGGKQCEFPPLSHSAAL